MRHLTPILFALAALTLAASAGARTPSGATPELTVGCGTNCVAGEYMTATGIGFDPRRTYGGCIDGPSSPGCFGLTNGVSQDGTISSTVRLSVFSVPGQYTWRIVHWQGNKQITDATAAFTLNPPAPAP